MSGRRSTALPWVGLGIVLLGIAVVAGAPTPRNDRPLDPRANGPRGAKAVVVLLDELGAELTVTGGAPDRDVATALVLRDRFDGDDRDQLRRWVRDGGILVVADPLSPLHEGQAPGSCPVALAGVDTLDAAPGPGGELDRGESCFDGFVSTAALGEGTVVSIADPGLFTNRLLGDADNAVLAAALLAPTGAERVAFLQGPAGSGDEALFDLLGPRVAQAIGQLAVAFGLYVLWRGRRLGRPVVEPQLVSVAGSELVTAVGRMLGSRRRPDEAAATIRADVRRALERRLGLTPDTPIHRVAAAVADRAGLDPSAVAAALATRAVRSDADLTDIVTDLDRIRDLALGPPATVGAQPPGGTP